MMRFLRRFGMRATTQSAGVMHFRRAAEEVPRHTWRMSICTDVQIYLRAN